METLYPSLCAKCASDRVVKVYGAPWIRVCAKCQNVWTVQECPQCGYTHGGPCPQTEEPADDS